MINIEMPKLSRTVMLRDFCTIRYGFRGVYVFKNVYGDVVYVGQTKSFKTRIRTHIRDAYFSAHIAAVDLYYIDDGYEREVYETFMIDALKPRYNKGKVFGNHLEEIAAIEDDIEMMEEQRRELTEEIEELRSELRPIHYDEENFDDRNYETDEDEYDRHALGVCLYAVERIREVKSEIRRLTTLIRAKVNLIK